MAGKMKPQIERLEKLRADLQGKVDQLTQQLAGVDMAIETLRLEGVKDSLGWGAPPAKKRARNVKNDILRLLEEAGASGLSANDVVAKGAAEGITLDRGTVSSLLSRLKKEGTLTYNGTEYAIAGGSKEGKAVQSLAH